MSWPFLCFSVYRFTCLFYNLENMLCKFIGVQRFGGVKKTHGLNLSAHQHQRVSSCVEIEH